ARYAPRPPASRPRRASPRPPPPASAAPGRASLPAASPRPGRRATRLAGARTPDASFSGPSSRRTPRTPAPPRATCIWGRPLVSVLLDSLLLAEARVALRAVIL